METPPPLPPLHTADPASPPDLPPGLPPDEPTPAPSNGGRIPIAAWIAIGSFAVIGLLVLAVIGAVLIPALAKARARAQEIRERQAGAPAAAPTPAPAASAPLSAAQRASLEAFGRELAEKLVEGDGVWVGGIMDVEVISDRTLSGLSVPAAFRRGFGRGLNTSQGGFLQPLLGLPCRYLRVRERDGHPAVQLRFTPESGGVGFIDILVRSTPEGWRMVDGFNYPFGALMTREMRLAAAMMTKPDAGTLGRLLGTRSMDVQVARQFAEFMELHQAGRSQEVIGKYDSLPETFRKAPICFTLLIHALQQLREDEAMQARYLRELEAAPEIVGKDAAISLLLVDLHVGRNDFVKAARAVEDALKVVGRDGLLLQMQGVFELKAGNTAAADRCLAEADQLEPDLPELLDLRLLLRTSKADFAGAIADMERFEKETGVQVNMEALADPQYETLRRSAEFRRWAARRK